MLSKEFLPTDIKLGEFYIFFHPHSNISLSPPKTWPKAQQTFGWIWPEYVVGGFLPGSGAIMNIPFPPRPRSLSLELLRTFLTKYFFIKKCGFIEAKTFCSDALISTKFLTGNFLRSRVESLVISREKERVPNWKPDLLYLNTDVSSTILFHENTQKVLFCPLLTEKSCCKMDM